MRVGIVLLNWSIGGSEKRFLNLFNYLSHSGQHEYKLIINRYLLDKLENMGFSLDCTDEVEIVFDDYVGRRLDQPFRDVWRNTIIRIPGPNFCINTLIGLLHCLGLKREAQSIQSLELDVAHYVFPKLGGCLGLKSARVLSCQDTLLRPLKSAFFREGLYGNAYLDIASERIKDRLLHETELDDSFRFQVNPCSFIDYSKTYVNNKEPIVVFMGSLISAKNPLLFIEAMKAVIARVPGVRGYVLGKGRLDGKIGALIRQYGLEGTIIKGFQLNPEDILARALIFVSIQEQDNYHSQALMEAMACGCAIVASNVGQTPELISSDVGFRVSLTPEDIANRIVWLLEHPDVAEELGQNARKKVMTEQTVERFASYIDDLYEDAHVNAKPS
jgi:glycosyltransferase involved in cell wall biosynthesis